MRLLTLSVALVAVAALLGTVPAAADLSSTPGGVDDAVVIAVVDSGFSPYHLNWRADGMPQHLDADPANDLPLDTSPAGWLPGFALTDDVTSMAEMPLTLPDDPDASIAELRASDGASIPVSTAGDVHVRWIPDTKIIGAVDFAGSWFGTNTSHGNGTSSVAAGNIHGTCPECLVVLVRYGSGAQAEAASNWVMNQPWIDVVTNSFGFSTLMRDRIYDGSDTELQRLASERGQTVFFSAGNGQANTFTAPNTTYQSSQEGPDWIITVGATDPDGGSYTGAGKPADMASIGTGYPSGYGGSTVSGSGTFGGTSNATPVSAGTYARALYDLRTAMEGPSRAQDGGVIATGTASCGAAVADCAVGDGALTATELRFGLLHSLERTEEGLVVGLVGGPALPANEETELMAEGHGTLFGRLDDDATWLSEVAAITEPLLGERAPLARTQAEQDWMVVDSYCRQEVHGTWGGGYYVDGETELPTISGPLTTALQQACPVAFSVLRSLGEESAPSAAEDRLPR